MTSSLPAVIAKPPHPPASNAATAAPRHVGHVCQLLPLRLASATQRDGVENSELHNGAIAAARLCAIRAARAATNAIARLTGRSLRDSCDRPPGAAIAFWAPVGCIFVVITPLHNE
jgi:hypothetical protein